jgi:hypothetical protein
MHELLHSKYQNETLKALERKALHISEKNYICADTKRALEESKRTKREEYDTLEVTVLVRKARGLKVCHLFGFFLPLFACSCDCFALPSSSSSSSFFLVLVQNADGFFGRSDPYVTLSMEGQPTQDTAVVMNDLNPVWNASFLFKV